MELRKSLPYTDHVPMENATTPELQRSNFTEFNVRRDKGTPYYIRLHDAVVKDLERLMILGGDQPGVLLGTIEVGDSCTIAVEDSEPCAELEERIRTWKPRAANRL